MSNIRTRSRAAPSPSRLSAEEEEALYFRDPNPGVMSIDLDQFQVDRICTMCGHWKSEHPWETCTEPNWL
jgi:hypothetical protein